MTPWLAVVLSACTTPSADGEDGETGDTGTDEPQSCADPGSLLFDQAKPAPEPGPNSQPFTCGTGWGTDAPQLDATWTAALPAVSTDNPSSIQMERHPDGGVVVTSGGLFARVDADGEQVWSFPEVAPIEAEIVMTVEQAGTIVVAVYQWSNESYTVDRYAADGSLIGPAAIPWNGVDGQVWGLTTNGDELIIGGFDIDGQGSWENTLLRLDADGNELLRKSTNMTNSGLLAVNDSGTVLFGAFPSFLLSLDTGAVQGILAPSAGGISAVAGYGSDFVIAGTAVADLSVGRYSAAGVEQWLQTYDRATLGDSGRAAAGNADGVVVAGLTQLLDFPTDLYWFTSQPIVFGVDEDGNAVWSDRISALGDTSAVVLGDDGEVYVAGWAEGFADEGDDVPPLLGWVRRYDP